MRLELTNGSALVQKIVGAAILPEEKGGQILAMISTDSIDSDGDSIQQGKTDAGGGWQLDRFNKHPVMLWMHDHQRPSMGKAEAYLDKYEGGLALFAKGEFDPEDSFARQIESKIRRGVLSETSVGFVASKYAPINQENPWGGYNFYQQDLIEFSWVNRGANPDVESFIKSACLSCPTIGEYIETNQDPELKEMKEEFTARLKAMEAQVNTILNGAAGKVHSPETSSAFDSTKWNRITELARKVAEAQEAIR